MGIAAQNKRRGKAYQSRLAKRLGGENIGTLGGEDIRHPYLSVEAKTRKVFVGEKYMSQAKANCPTGKIPIVVIHVVGREYKDDLVLIRLADFEDLYGDIRGKRDDGSNGGR